MGLQTWRPASARSSCFLYHAVPALVNPAKMLTGPDATSGNWKTWVFFSDICGEVFGTYKEAKACCCFSFVRGGSIRFVCSIW